MQRIITDLIPQFNKNISESTNESVLTTRFLPEFHRRLVRIYHDDWLSGIKKSPRSLKELGFRFNKRPDYISFCLRELEEWGWLASDPHGSAIKKRWITFDAFCELESKNTSQNTNQILSIPYIDLTDQEMINSKILEHQQNCAKLDDPTLELNEKLNLFLEIENVHPKRRERIKTTLNQSRIGPVRQEKVLNRVIAQSRKRIIGNKRAYFLACIQNEMKDLKHTFDCLAICNTKNINVNLYEQL